MFVSISWRWIWLKHIFKTHLSTHPNITEDKLEEHLFQYSTNELLSASGVLALCHDSKVFLVR